MIFPLMDGCDQAALVMAIAARLLTTHFSLESTLMIRGQRHLADCWQ